MLDNAPEGDRSRVASQVADCVWAAGTSGEAAHRHALWRATALLINTPGLHRQLLHAVGNYVHTYVVHILYNTYLI